MNLSRVEVNDLFEFSSLENWDKEAFAAEHEPDDAQLPILETVHMRVRMRIEIQQGAGGDEVFTTALAVREQEGDVGHLFCQDVDGAVDPDRLFVRIRKDR